MQKHQTNRAVNSVGKKHLDFFFIQFFFYCFSTKMQ